MYVVSINDIGRDLTRRRLSSRRCLHRLQIRRIETFDKRPAEKSRQRRIPLPESGPRHASADPLENRKHLSVGHNKVIDALRDAPFLRAGLPVELLTCETAKGVPKVL